MKNAWLSMFRRYLLAVGHIDLVDLTYTPALVGH